MGLFTKSLVALVVVGSTLAGTQSVIAQQGISRFWPFSKSAETAASATAASDASAVSTQKSTGGEVTQTSAMFDASAEVVKTPEDKEDSWLVTSPLANITWPKVEMPKIKWNAFGNKEDGIAPERPSTWQTVSQGVSTGATKVANNAKATWSSTVDLFRFNNANDQTRVAQRSQKKPSFWSRLLGTQSEPAAGPRTVTEWMAQERLDP